MMKTEPAPGVIAGTFVDSRMADSLYAERFRSILCDHAGQ